MKDEERIRLESAKSSKKKMQLKTSKYDMQKMLEKEKTTKSSARTH